MRQPRVGLVHPPLDAFPSGGNTYDAQLLAQSRRTASPWLSVCWPALDGPTLHCDVLLWDSLLLGQVQRQRGEHLGLLLHYLPSCHSEGLDRSAAYALEKRALAQADFAITTGEGVADAIRRRAPGLPVHVCEPGVDNAFRPRRSPRPARPLALLTVANLLPAKGHEALVALLEQLRDRDWHWHVVGADDRRFGIEALLRARTERAGLADRIFFHGPLPQGRVAGLMADCDLLLHPSRAESYGMVLAEAVACGLPVLSFRVGAASRLIQHGENGVLVESEDWTALAAHLHRLLVEPSLCTALARGSTPVSVRRWEQTFSEVQNVIAALLP